MMIVLLAIVIIVLARMAKKQAGKPSLASPHSRRVLTPRQQRRADRAIWTPPQFPSRPDVPTRPDL
jgi:hypothetical protein